MLSQEDSRRLAQLERQLWHDDPEFCARMSGAEVATHRRRRFSLSLSVTALVIATAAAVLGAVGWWLAAVIAGVCASVVLAATVLRGRHHSRA